MVKNFSRLFLFFAIIFPLLLFMAACGPSAEQREQQRIEDSLRHEQQRLELMERTGRMLDSISPAPTDSL